MKRSTNMIILITATLLIMSCHSSKNQLNVYNWGAYIGETTIKDFEDSTKINANYSTYSSNEEMLGKILASNVSYDIIFPSDYMVNQMINKDLLYPINFKLIPNYKNISKKFVNLPYDSLSKYSIPYYFGTCGIGYNKKYVTDSIKGFEILLDERYKNKIVVLDDMRFLFAAALKYLGYSANTKNTAELDSATSLLKKVKKNIKSFSVTNYIDLLINEDAVIVFGYSAGVFQAKAKNPNIEYIIPQEGAVLYVDNICILKNSRNIPNAHKFINFILDPKNSAKITNTVYSGSPNEAAFQFIDKSISLNPGIFPSKNVLEKSEFLQTLGEIGREYEKRWIEIKK
jgi:spermidine/putrescine transport system substrate-binding protein